MNLREAARIVTVGVALAGCAEPYPGASTPYGFAPPAPSWPTASPPYAGPYRGSWPVAVAGAGPDPGAQAAVGFALSQIGRPYCWGGNGPSCYDCSGFTRAAWRAGGRLLPRTSEEQAAGLMPVAPGDLRPGDVLWRPGHVALYVGQGWAVAATHTGDFVRYQRADGFVRAVRPL